MGELKKQHTDTSIGSINVVKSVRQLNDRMLEFLYEPNNPLISSYLERFESATNMKRERVF